MFFYKNSSIKLSKSRKTGSKTHMALWPKTDTHTHTHTHARKHTRHGEVMALLRFVGEETTLFMCEHGAHRGAIGAAIFMTAAGYPP